MAHGAPGEPGADSFIAQADAWERLLAEERERTTVITLANDDKRQELRTLRTQRDTLLDALKALVTVKGVPEEDGITMIANRFGIPRRIVVQARDAIKEAEA